MPELEVGEMIILIIAIFPMTFSYFVVKARRDILKWLPGYFCFYLNFLCTNLEALALPDVFNFLEHFFLMLAGIFLASAVFHEFYTKVLNERKNPIKQQRGLVRE
ncbi:MAG: hypothetical protein ACFFDK_02220 [Promethearchaeota archaeon]